MPTSLIVTVLCAAMLHAGWNALAKGQSGSDPLVATMVLAMACGVVALPVLAIAGLPSAASTVYVIVSGAVHVVYFLLVGLSYRYADYSAVYPLMRGAAPLITTLMGAAFLAEPLTATLLCGVGLLSAGVLGLGANAMRSGGLNTRGLAVAAANIAVIVGYTLLDGVGVRLSGNAAGYVSAMLALTAVMLAPVTLWLRPASIVADLKAYWRIGLLGGTMAMLSYGVALWAMTRAPIGAVAALRETSVLFGTAIAAVFLKERFGPERWLAAAAICAGLGLIRLG
jgi:drug/metabolite transporter (DMT)-like permease